MVDITRLHNYKASMEVYASTQGFEEEALGALIGLTIYGQMSHQGQTLWTTAAQKAVSYGNSSGLPRSMFYSDLLHKRLMCWGSGIAPDYANFMFESFPWGLPDKLFYEVYKDLQAGKGKAHESEYSWDNVTDKVGDISKKAAEYGPAVGLAMYFVKKFGASYAPELAALIANPLAIAAGTAVVWSAVELHKINAKIQNHYTQERYAVDAERRRYDSSNSLVSGN